MNEFCYMTGNDGKTVLIDTWWNVNYEACRIIRAAYYVLIDTWWNVNNKDYPIYDNNDSVLIDTWWNVNMSIVDFIAVVSLF